MVPLLSPLINKIPLKTKSVLLQFYTHLVFPLDLVDHDQLLHAEGSGAIRGSRDGIVAIVALR